VRARSSKSAGKISTERGKTFLDYGHPDMPEVPRAVEVHAIDDCLAVSLADGRELRLPLEFFVALRDATPQQIENVEYIDDGRDLHWPDLDEDIHVVDLLYPPRLAKEFK
jgi:hypothetical protein